MLRSPRLCFLWVLALSLIPAATLMACDSARPDPIGPHPVNLGAPIPDVVISSPSSVRVVDISGAFSYGGPLPLGLAYSTDTDAATVTWDDATHFRLRITPAHHGSTVVSVTATSPEGVSQSTAFRVTVTESADATCPGPGPGLADYFPLEPGQVWTFDFERRSRSFGSGPPMAGRLTGSATMTITSVSCRAGTRSVIVLLDVTADHFYGQEGYEAYVGPFIQRETRTFVESTGGDVTFMPPFWLNASRELVAARYAPHAGPEVVEVAIPPSATCGQGGGGTAEFGRDRGLTSISASCGSLHASGGFNTSYVLTRRTQ